MTKTVSEAKGTLLAELYVVVKTILVDGRRLPGLFSSRSCLKGLSTKKLATYKMFLWDGSTCIKKIVPKRNTCMFYV